MNQWKTYVQTARLKSRDSSNAIGKVSALVLLLLVCLPVTARANSSWVWIAETRPRDILPFAVVGTLAFETAVLILAARPKNKKKALGAVCLGNVCSFLAPYILRILAGFDGVVYENFYIVGTIFLVTTLVVELPIEYYMLAKDTERKRWLIAAILIANIVSTGAIAGIERTLCRGYWA